MRFITRNVDGVLRVENPPFRVASISEVDGEELVKLRIRFAFDAIRAVNEGRPTVNLVLRKNSRESARKQLLPKTISLKEAARSISSISQSKTSSFNSTQLENQTKEFVFDLLDSMPDESIRSLKAGEKVKYEYLKTVKAQFQEPVVEILSQRSNSKEYMLSLVSRGIDPATLSETFPVPDPVTGKNEKKQKSKFNFFTRKTTRLNDFENEYILSNFLIFEKEIELSKQEFIEYPFYEFDYLGLQEGSATKSSVKIELDIFEVLNNLSIYLQQNLQDEDKVFEKRIDSYFAINSGKFSGVDRLSTSPSIVRTVNPSIAKNKPVAPFKSNVYGNASSPNGRGFSTLRQEPDVFPFFISSNEEGTVINLLKSPPSTSRVEVLAKNLTKKDLTYKVIALSFANSESRVSIPITLESKNSIYELKIRSYDLKSRATLSSNTVTFSNKLSYQGAKINVSQIRKTSSGQSSILIGAALTDSGRQDLTGIISQLTSAGVSEEVLRTLRTDSSLYSEIFSFRVEETSLSTGIQRFSKELTPSADSPNSEYVFTSSDPLGTVLTISLGMKSPDSLIPSQPNFRFGKFGGFYRQSQPSFASLEKNKKSGEQFDYTDTGVKVTVFVPPETNTGEILELSASRTFRSSTFLRWTYNGDLSVVDHFQILGTAFDSECLLGCAYGTLSFEDTVLSERVGISKYSVRPVYSDLSTGTSAEVYQTINSSLPKILSPKFIQGSTWKVEEGFSTAISSPLSKSNTFLGNNVVTTQQLSIESSVERQLPAFQVDVPQPIVGNISSVTSSINKKFTRTAPSINVNMTSSTRSSQTTRKVLNVNK